MSYLGARPLLVQLQTARVDESVAQWALRGARGWRKLPLWWHWVGCDARKADAWAALTEQDWDAVATEEIRHVAGRYWRDHELQGNPFHPRGRAHLDQVAAAVLALPRRELSVPVRQVTERLTPDRVPALIAAEIARLEEIAADPTMVSREGPATRGRSDDGPGRRELIVQHRGSGLRAQFIYGGREYAEVGWVVSKTYSTTSVDPDRVESNDSRASAWRTYAGLGIGMMIYTHASQLLPEMRWEDGSVSPYGKAVRRKLHTLDPWRWEMRDCGCSREWRDLVEPPSTPCPPDGAAHRPA